MPYILKHATILFPLFLAATAAVPMSGKAHGSIQT